MGINLLLHLGCWVWFGFGQTDTLPDYQTFIWNKTISSDHLLYLTKPTELAQYDLHYQGQHGQMTIKNVAYDQTIHLSDSLLLVKQNSTGYFLLDLPRLQKKDLPEFVQFFHFEHAERVVGITRDQFVCIYNLQWKELDRFACIGQFTHPSNQQGFFYQDKINNEDHLLFYRFSEKKAYSVASSSKLNLKQQNACFIVQDENQCSRLIDIQKVELYSGKSLDSVLRQPVSHLSVLHNGQLFIKTRRTTTSETPTYAEIWDSNDKFLYTDRKKESGFKNETEFSYLYNPLNDQITAVKNFDQSNSLFSIDHLYQIGLDKYTWFDYSTYYKTVDLYVNDLSTQTTHLALNQHYNLNNSVIPSPFHRSFLYLKEFNWYSYDIDTKKHRNLTNHYFVPLGEDKNVNDRYFPKPYWLDDSLHMAFVYKNQFLLIETLTGKVVYTFTDDKVEELQIEASFLDRNKILRHPHGIYIQGRTKNGTILYHFSRYQLHAILDLPFKISQVTPTSSGILYLYENHQQPPTLAVLETVKRESNDLVAYKAPSSPDFKAELIDFQGRDNRNYRGILYYPVGYKPHQKYPLVLSIYEKQSHKFTKYYYANEVSGNGLNVIELVRNGYMVYLPDLIFETGSPGHSALHSLHEHLHYLEHTHSSVDFDKLGLMGMSFGSYLTNFILTQTNVFKAAISGSGFSNLISDYHSINTHFNYPRFMFYEDYQLRMGVPFYLDKKRYFDQNPIHFVDQLSTPLLIWAGKEDVHVESRQSIELYLALYRQKKTAQLILFEKEKHELSKVSNKHHLNKAILQWFATYLKDEQ
jgi:dipeptidyl aminopeptidase/acylaminoacyl peptidase